MQLVRTWRAQIVPGDWVAMVVVDEFIALQMSCCSVCDLHWVERSEALPGLTLSAVRQCHRCAHCYQVWLAVYFASVRHQQMSLHVCSDSMNA